MIKYMAVAVAVAVSGGVAVPVAVPMATTKNTKDFILKGFFEHVLNPKHCLRNLFD